MARRSLLLVLALPLALPLAGATGARPDGLALYEHHARDAASTIVTFTTVNRGASAAAGIRVCEQVTASARTCRRVGTLQPGEAFTFELRVRAAGGRGYVESGSLRSRAIRV